MNEIVANDKLGAFCRHTHVEVKGAASGPLAGLTCAVKDIYDIAGGKTGFGSPDWLRTHGPAARTAPAVQLLLDAGAHVVGKAHTEEMAWSLTGENAHYGTPGQRQRAGPHPRRILERFGGGGRRRARRFRASAATPAARCGCPASYCGILGLRPTHGRISLEDVCPLASSFDTCGWFARDAAVFERVGRVLLRDAAPARTPRRLLLAQDAVRSRRRGAAAALEPGLDKVAALIGEPERVTVGDEPLTQWMDYFRFPQGAEAWAAHGEWMTREKPQFGPAIKGRFEWAPSDRARGCRAGAGAARRDHPAHGGAAAGRRRAGAAERARHRAAARTRPRKWWTACARGRCPCCASPGLARLPQVSLPLATLDGCPLGLSLVAARGNDTMLLELARKLV